MNKAVKPSEFVELVGQPFGQRPALGHFMDLPLGKGRCWSEADDPLFNIDYEGGGISLTYINRSPYLCVDATWYRKSVDTVRDDHGNLLPPGQIFRCPLPFGIDWAMSLNEIIKKLGAPSRKKLGKSRSLPLQDGKYDDFLTYSNIGGHWLGLHFIDGELYSLVIDTEESFTGG